jgi:hypothetical protein
VIASLRRPRDITLAVAIAAATAAPACRQGPDIAAAVSDIESRYSVTVVYEIGPDFFPPELSADPYNAKAQPIRRRDLAHLLQLIPAWLDKYPKAVLSENLRSIRLCRSAELFGVNLGGTYSDRDIFLAAAGTAEGYDDRQLELAFHHEFSSLFIFRHRFPGEAWLAANPPELTYPEEWEEWLESAERDRDLRGSDALYRQGLLAEYGRSSIENDFNLYAEIAFTDPELMKRLMAQYPVVRAKYLVLKSYYLSISPEFAAWFDRIG